MTARRLVAALLLVVVLGACHRPPVPTPNRGPVQPCVDADDCPGPILHKP